MYARVNKIISTTRRVLISDFLVEMIFAVNLDPTILWLIKLDPLENEVLESKLFEVPGVPISKGTRPLNAAAVWIPAVSALDEVRR